MLGEETALFSKPLCTACTQKQRLCSRPRPPWDHSTSRACPLAGAHSFHVTLQGVSHLLAWAQSPLLLQYLLCYDSLPSIFFVTSSRLFPSRFDPGISVVFISHLFFSSRNASARLKGERMSTRIPTNQLIFFSAYSSMLLDMEGGSAQTEDIAVINQINQPSCSNPLWQRCFEIGLLASCRIDCK